MDLQDSLMTVCPDEIGRSELLYLLRNGIGDMLAQYDITLIDCPPSLGLITQNGLAISDYCLIPVVPEALSTHGIPQVISRIKRFNQATGSMVQILGRVATRFREQSKAHHLNLLNLREGSSQRSYRRVMHAVVHESAQAAKAVDYNRKANTLRAKYGYEQTFIDYQELTREVLQYVRE
jgi:chromosome partitioning protein